MKGLYLAGFIAFMIPVLSGNGQWKKVAVLPAINYYSMVYQNRVMYASGHNKLYTSANEGLTWDSTAAIEPGIQSIDDFCLFENEIYTASYGRGVYKSSDNGKSWKNITFGIDRYINDFFVWKNRLYASTDDGGVYRLTNSKEQWEPFKNGFYWSTSSSISGNSICMVAAGGANGSIFRYTEETGIWQEYFVKDRIAPGLSVSDIISVNDTLYAATSNGIYSSTNGMQWTNTGTIRSGSYIFLANVKQAVFAVVNYGLNQVAVYKKPKENTNVAWERTDEFSNTVVYELLVTHKYLWQARMDGLYFKALSDYGVTPIFDDVETTFTIGKIFPNPAVQKVQLRIEIQKTKSLSFNVSNILGQVILKSSQNEQLEKGMNTISIDRPLPSGLYYLTLMIDGKKYTRSFLIKS